MAIQPRPESGLAIGRFVRWGVHGGAAAALIPLLMGVAAASGWAGDAGLILVAGTLLGGGLPTLAMMALSRGRNPLAYVERDLARARMMMDKRLINEEEYQRLKSHILEVFQAAPGPARPLWPVAFWGSVIGVTVFSLMAIQMTGSWMLEQALGTTLLTALIGGSVVGGGAQAYQALSGGSDRAGLPAPKDHRLLDR